MGTLSSELGPHAPHLSNGPRLYVDANLPAGAVAFMRERLRWDVLFVVEHDDLRRAPDVEHYRIARQLGRTLISHDRDYCDDRRFPPDTSGGVIVVIAPDARALEGLLRRVDRIVFDRSRRGGERQPPAPLEGRKILVDVDWPSRRRRPRDRRC